MAHWQETAEIARRLVSLDDRGVFAPSAPLAGFAALATVVRVDGPAYRRAGAKLLVEESGATLGSISGGCLEADVRAMAREVIASGRPARRLYDATTDEDLLFGLGLGCGGEVEVFVQPVGAIAVAKLFRPLLERMAEGVPVVIATALELEDWNDGALVLTRGQLAGAAAAAHPAGDFRSTTAEVLASGVAELRTVDGHSVFLEPLSPPPTLFVFGASDDSQPLVARALECGFRVQVVDHRSALLTRERFPGVDAVIEARPVSGENLAPVLPGALAVVKMHSLAHDREWARLLLAAGASFVGLLGPHARTEAIAREIGAAGDERLFGPVGLDLGADGPRQIAISIVAELLAFLAGRDARNLRSSGRSIHAD